MEGPRLRGPVIRDRRSGWRGCSRISLRSIRVTAGQLSLRLLVRIDHVARLVFSWRHYGLSVHRAELLDVVAFVDAMELDLQYPPLRPFAVLAEFDVADDGLEGVGTEVVGELLVFDALRSLDGLRQHLELRVAPRGHVIAERVDAFGLGPRLIFFDQVFDTGELHLRHRQPHVIIDEGVEHPARLTFEYRCLRTSR